MLTAALNIINICNSYQQNSADSGWCSYIFCHEILLLLWILILYKEKPLSCRIYNQYISEVGCSQTLLMQGLELLNNHSSNSSSRNFLSSLEKVNGIHKYIMSKNPGLHTSSIKIPYKASSKQSIIIILRNLFKCSKIWNWKS